MAPSASSSSPQIQERTASRFTNAIVISRVAMAGRVHVSLVPDSRSQPNNICMTSDCRLIYTLNAYVDMSSVIYMCILI